MNKPCMVLALALALSCAGVSAQQVYRWVDGNGRIHYGSEPPPGAAKAAVQPRINSYGSQSPRAEITMYVTAWCPYCRKAREFLARRGIAYRELDIEKSPAARAEYDRLGGRGVPLILVGEKRMQGYREETLARLLKSAGY